MIFPLQEITWALHRLLYDCKQSKFIHLDKNSHSDTSSQDNFYKVGTDC